MADETIPNRLRDTVIAEHCWLLFAPIAFLDFDQRRSRLFLHADVGLLFGFAQVGRAGAWMAKLHQLEESTHRFGLIPQQNTRRPESKSALERSLAEWLRRQRRAAREGRLCSYQLARLRGLPIPFYESHSDYWWNNRFHSYRLFLLRRKRPPNVHGRYTGEQGLARWAAKQRYFHRKGLLSAERVTALAALSIWTWGHSLPENTTRRPTRTPSTAAHFQLHPSSCTDWHTDEEYARCVTANVARRSSSGINLSPLLPTGASGLETEGSTWKPS